MASILESFYLFPWKWQIFSVVDESGGEKYDVTDDMNGKGWIIGREL